MSVSPRAMTAEERMARELPAGAAMGGVVNPRRTVTVYRSLDESKVLTESDELIGGDVVPGFRCRVEEIFVEEKKSEVFVSPHATPGNNDNDRSSPRRWRGAKSLGVLGGEPMSRGAVVPTPGGDARQRLSGARGESGSAFFGGG